MVQIFVEIVEDNIIVTASELIDMMIFNGDECCLEVYRPDVHIDSKQMIQKHINDTYDSVED